MGVAHGLEKDAVLAHKAAIDAHLAEAGHRRSATRTSSGAAAARSSPRRSCPRPTRHGARANGIDPERCGREDETTMEYRQIEGHATSPSRPSASASGPSAPPGGASRTAPSASTCCAAPSTSASPSSTPPTPTTTATRRSSCAKPWATSATRSSSAPSSATTSTTTRSRPNQQERPHDWSPGYMRKALEESLRRLGTDHIDLYQLHNPRIDAIDGHDELWAELEKAQDEGLIRARRRRAGTRLRPAPGGRGRRGHRAARRDARRSSTTCSSRASAPASSRQRARRTPPSSRACPTPRACSTAPCAPTRSSSRATTATGA